MYAFFEALNVVKYPGNSNLIYYMATKKKTPNKTTTTTSTSDILSRMNPIQLRPKNQKVRGTLYALIAIFLLLSAFTLAGPIGIFVQNKIVLKLFGYGFIIIPFILAYAAIKNFRGEATPLGIKIALGILSISILGLLHILFGSPESLFGGLAGKLVASPLISGFEKIFSGILLAVAAFISGFIAFDSNFSSIDTIKKRIADIRLKRRTVKEEERDIDEQIAQAVANGTHEEYTAEEEDTEEEEVTRPQDIKPAKKVEKSKTPKEDEITIDNSHVFASSYVTPPLSLLAKSSGKVAAGDIKSNATIIQRTLANFGIAVEMDEISVGPTVTRYAIKPAQGVRLTRIASLQNELALALAAKSIRIEAPIPGRSLVGIEVPNTNKSMIGLGTLLADPEFTGSPEPLLVSLGKGVSGASHYIDIGSMPHALIAGTTGSGKSVSIHNIIISLLYRNGPDMMRFIMVDPKRVEMTLYKKIPHLLTPVITEPKKAVLALSWAVKEMERRYDILQQSTVRDISSYHKTIVKPAYKNLTPEQIEDKGSDLPERMPYIVIVIDELSDIMSTYPRELEAGIVRLAQMSRAVGIHLLLSTQRPSVNVITGLIKANVPTRIALKVASQIDSRTILDSQGAEKLLGQGDMLFKGPKNNEPIRIQCPYVSEEEVKDVVEFIKKNYQFELEDEINLPDDHNDGAGGVSFGDDSDGDDPLYEEARITVIQSKKASTSFLQRKLGIGYSRAARIMDILEDRGVIGPQNGSKPRDILESGGGTGHSSDNKEDYDD
jgi:S-DNA-T family DNA segregation ATPase FtsK/SpoIIIE